LSRQATVSSLQPGPESTASPNAAAPDPAERSLVDDLRRLSEDARALARAELAYQKSRAAFAGQEVKRITLLGLLAGVLVFFALMALTLGLVLALTPLLTALGATAAVVGGLLAIAALCALVALGRWRRMVAALSDETT
jgi:hypothetical protein